MRASHPTLIAIETSNAPDASDGRRPVLLRAEELARFDGTANAPGRFTDAATLLDKRVLGDFEQFHTVVGYRCWNE